MWADLRDEMCWDQSILPSEQPEYVFDAMMETSTFTNKFEYVEARRFFSWHTRFRRFDRQWSVVRAVSKFLVDILGTAEESLSLENEDHESQEAFAQTTCNPTWKRARQPSPLFSKFGCVGPPIPSMILTTSLYSY